MVHSFSRGRTALAAAAVVALAVVPASAQTCPQPVELELTSVPLSGDPDNMKAWHLSKDAGTYVSDFAGTYYFTATTFATGRELYRTDGTAAGTALVSDIFFGGDADPSELVGAPGRVYFLADDGVHGRELWTSDGTAAGTVLLLDAWPGSFDGTYTDLAVLGSKALFGARHPVTGDVELWSTDGTPAGTMQLADLNPSASSWPGEFQRAPGGGELYFSANHPVFGSELWKTDGTAAGTVFVADIHPNGSAGIRDFVNAGGLTYFDAASTGSGRELWVTDGSTAGTQRMATFDVGGFANGQLSLNHAVDFGGRLVFSATAATGGMEVWISDGTAAGTVEFIDLNPGPAPSFPFAFAPLGADLLFVADTLATGAELWRADANGNVTLVTEMKPGSADGFATNFRGFLDAGGVLLFSGDAGAGAEVWVTDGTSVGTALFADLEPAGGSQPLDLTLIGPGSVLLSAETALHGRELWRVTGTGSKSVIEIDPTVQTVGSEPDELAGIGQRLFFAGDVGTGSEPFIWTPGAGHTSLGDLWPGPPSSAPADFARVGTGSDERIVFSAATAEFGRELFATDGTAPGTQLLADLWPGPNSAFPAEFAEVGGRLVFSAFEPSVGYELFVTDGTVAGTGLLLDMTPGFASSEPRSFVRWGARLVFVVNPGGGTGVLAVTDGTAAGTSPLVPLAGLQSQGLPFVVGERVYFSARSGGFGLEQWVTDGTVAGTMRLTDAWAGPQDSDPIPLGAVGDTFYFSARSGNFDRRLWKTSGTPASTTQVANLNVWPSYGGSTTQTAAGLLFFRAEGSENKGFELWRSDGTAAGTFRLSDFVEGNQGSSPSELIATATGVYFVASSDAYGRELFFSDGTVLGTTLVCDLYPGPESGLPYDLVHAAGGLALAGTGLFTGEEVHFAPLGGAHAADLGAGLDLGLSATPGVLGGSTTLTTTGIAPSDPSALAWSLPVTTPSAVLVLPGYANWLDLGSAQLAGVFLGDWQATRALPANPGLAGLTVHLQAFALPGGSLPSATTNGVALTLGTF